MVKPLSRIQASISLAGRISGICSTIPQSFEFVIAPLYLSFPRWAYCTTYFLRRQIYLLDPHILPSRVGWLHILRLRDTLSPSPPYSISLSIAAYLQPECSMLLFNLSTLLVTARRIDDDASTQSLPVST